MEPNTHKPNEEQREMFSYVNSFVLSSRLFDRTSNMLRPIFLDSSQWDTYNTARRDVHSKQGRIETTTTAAAATTTTITAKAQATRARIISIYTHMLQLEEPETNHSTVASRQSVVLRWRERIDEAILFFLLYLLARLSLSISSWN